MEPGGKQVILFLNGTGRRALGRVLVVPKKERGGVLGLALDADANGVWFIPAGRVEPLEAILVKWEFVDTVIGIVELEPPRQRPGFSLPAS